MDAIRLRTGDVVPVAANATWTDEVNSAPLPAQVLVHFSKMPSLVEREALSASGITLLDYVPDNTFTAIIRQRVDKVRTTALPVHSVLPAQPEWKADSYLWRKAAVERGDVKVLLSVYEGVDVAEMRQLVLALGGKMADAMEYGCYIVSVPATRLRDLAGWYGVRYITPHMEPVPLDKQSIPAVKGSNAIATSLWGGYGLNGDSVTVGVGDNTAGIFHNDLRDRIVNYNPAQVTNHGIHINGIVGGAAIVNPLAASMTPKVKLLDFFFSTVLSATGSMLQQHNMTITNNSYTVVAGDCEYFGTYDLYSRFLDTMALQYPTVQHVFAAGNDGNMTCAPYPQGYGTMGGGYQPAKNTLVVGSTTHNLLQASDQSRGPVRDGRIRPDIVAVGASVFSCLRYDTYSWAGGTSMASPQVASGLAVLTQHYKRLQGAQPRADLLKAIMIATAMDLGQPGPDHSFGFGMMDVGRALKVLDDNRYGTGDVSAGEQRDITINIPAGIAGAKVTLYWNDIPASPTAATQLVNDLDLAVTMPGGVQRLPLVPDATLANLLNPATERADHLNNVEQVTIDAPTAGAYTITIKGHSVPFGPQHFVLVYDLLPKEVQLTYPIGGEQLSNVDSIRVFWNAVSDGNSFKVEFSPDNGDNWSVIDGAVPAWKRYCGFVTPGFNSGNCRVRLSRNGTSEVATSERFAITDTPHVVLAASQCPGYVNIHWNPVPNATAYEVLRKTGPWMAIADTVSDTAYSFAGMSLTEVSFVAVQPIVNGLRGYRSLAVTRRAGDGDCASTASTGDLMVERVVSPRSGRLLTSTSPGATSNLIVQVRNLYSVPCGNYTFSYSINGGVWHTFANPSGVLAANATAVVDIPGLPLAMPGVYNVLLAIHNNAVADPQPRNDTLAYTFKVLANTPVDLSTPFIDGFEDVGEFSVVHDSLGISPNGHWDFYNDDDSGRVRSYVYDEVVISGNRSMSLDQFMPMNQGSNNMLIGTFNLTTYDTATDEVRMDIDHVLHGIPNREAGNVIRARGVDALPWVDMHKYDMSVYPGTTNRVRSLSLTDAVRKGNYNFSASTQVAFCQNDTTLIAGRNYGSGITFDNFRIYTVTNDAMLAGVVSPQPNNCGLPGTIPLTVKVRNGVNHPLANVQVNYTLDGGAVHSGIIPSLGAKDSVNFIFADQMDISASATHKLNIWLTAAGDSYQPNDSIMGYEFLNSRIVSSYPYLENFENGDGGFYTSGFMSSWQYGTPAASRINKAASGTKAWKSNLTERYNSLERSYLYSPCYDIADLAEPMLSLSMAQDLENCGNILCDGAYLEYSFDGVEWRKLGAAGDGFHWYDAPFSIWNSQGFTRWHVATIALPQPPAGKVLHLRFILFADPAVTFEGLAIDDIHIYDRGHPIYPLNEQMVSLGENPASGVWTEYLAQGGLVAALRPANDLGNVIVTLYGHDTLWNTGRTQYIMPRSYAITSAVPPADSVRTMLYIEDADIVKVLEDTTCPSCAPLTDAYSLGVTQYYNNNDHSAENGTLDDDTGGTYVFHPYKKVQWVPYEKGYRAEVSIKPFSELWVNDGGPTRELPANTDAVNFVAYRNSERKPMIEWVSLIDVSVNTYMLQRSDDGYNFADIYQANAVHAANARYSYADTAAKALGQVVYYRLRYLLAGSDRVWYSPVRRLDITDVPGALVTLDAHMVSSGRAAVQWTSWIDGVADHYILERAVNDGGYTVINDRKAENRYGQRYTYMDMPGDIGTGTPVHYRLTAVMKDGSRFVMPIRTIYWVNDAAVYMVYPDPSPDGVLTIRWNADAGKMMHVSIMDITGRVVERMDVTADSWDNTTTLHTTAKPSGLYMVRFDIEGYRYITKVVFGRGR
ncbi:hypothetical protein GCM10023093_05390 [Nemorincola caseinilytica]|uniref:T9SS type A sorting domain-containing protein n=1 Tax=Nemorincola caseinilytica TaxID=2054315 RepID=A0ABP8N8S7_9BACT